MVSRFAESVQVRVEPTVVATMVASRALPSPHGRVQVMDSEISTLGATMAPSTIV